jgi:hypothetical protein
VTLLRDELAEANERVAQIERAIAAAPCRIAGCDMQHIGGRNAGCDIGRDCGCSVPVHACRRCGDSDYGDNAEAADIRAACARGEAQGGNW